MVAFEYGADLCLALGATIAAVGAIWQTIVAALLTIDAMSGFLGSQNALLREERRAVRRRIPRWRLLKIRRELKALMRQSNDVLTKDELALSKRYDQQTIGWSLTVVGSVTVAVASWMSMLSV